MVVSTGMVLGIVFLIGALIAGFATFKKVGTKIGVIVVMLVLAVGSMTVLPTLQGTTPAGTQPLTVAAGTQAVTTTTTSGACSLAGNSATLDVSGVNLDNPATALTETMRYTLNGGNERGTLTGGTAATISPGGKVYGLVSATGYYGAIVDEQLACEPATVLQPQLAQHGGLQFSVRDQNDAVNGPANTNTSIGSAGTAVFKITVNGNTTSTRRYFGHPKSGYVVVGLNLNTTAFQTSSSNTYVKNGESVAVPLSRTGTDELAFKVPFNNKLDSGSQVLELVVAGSESVDPQVTNNTGTAGGDRIGYTLMDATYSIHTVKGFSVPISLDVADNVGADLGGVDQSGTITYA